jgi:polyhydroxyalkanoate synthesis regulator phasin
MMIELMKKSMLIGIGVLSLTKDKVEEVAGELIDKGNMSQKEGEKFVDDVLKRSEETRSVLEEQIKAVVKSTMAKMDIAGKSDIEALRSEISELKERLAQAEPSAEPEN